VRARRFDRAGNVQGPAVALTPGRTRSTGVALAVTPTSTYAAWTTSERRPAVQARRVTLGGTAGDAVTLSRRPVQAGAIPALAGGAAGAAVAWIADDRVEVARVAR
jgi:hypothetical protein